MRTGLLRDHFALDAAVRDFNQVMPVVLPSGFKPGNPTARPTTTDSDPAARLRVLSEQRKAGKKKQVDGNGGVAGATVNPMAQGQGMMRIPGSDVEMAQDHYDEL